MTGRERPRYASFSSPFTTASTRFAWTGLVRYSSAPSARARARSSSAPSVVITTIGIPFSDPVMDGPVIQLASERALEAGATPSSVLDALRAIDAGVAVAVMTYYNICFRMGHERFARSLVESNVCAAILPDLPLEEVEPWAEVADRVGVETVLLAAPTAPDDRLPQVCARSRGFVYAVGLLGVTGERSELANIAANKL